MKMKQHKFLGMASETVEGNCELGDWVSGSLVGNHVDLYIVGDVISSDADGIMFEFWVPVFPETVCRKEDLK